MPLESNCLISMLQVSKKGLKKKMRKAKKRELLACVKSAAKLNRVTLSLPTTSSRRLLQPKTLSSRARFSEKMFYAFLSQRQFCAFARGAAFPMTQAISHDRLG